MRRNIFTVTQTESDDGPAIPAYSIVLIRGKNGLGNSVRRFVYYCTYVWSATVYGYPIQNAVTPNPFLLRT